VTKKGTSLRWRMILMIAGVPLLIMVPVLVSFGNLYTNAYRELYWDKSHIVANQIQYMVVNSVAETTYLSDKTIQEMLASFVRASEKNGIREFSFVAIVDSNGFILQHSTPGVVNTVDGQLTKLSEEAIYQRTSEYDPQDITWVTEREYEIGKLYLVSHPLTLPNADAIPYFLVIAMKATLVDPPIMPMILAAIIILLLVILLMQLFLNRTVLGPLSKIAEGVVILGAGELEHRIHIEQKGELGFVAEAFNSMAKQISDLVTSLEFTVKSRTDSLQMRNLQLEAVTLVGQEAAQQRSVDELLDTAVHTISDKFGFYHTAIFILNDEKTWAVLRSTSSDGGQRMLNRGHRLSVGKQGMVGNVAFTGKPRIALDVGDDAVFFRNQDLQSTRSEMTLPLIVENEVIGVLDIQSEEPAAFSTEDINVLQLVANQLAVALSNVRVLEALETTIAELRVLQTDYNRRGWAKLTRSDRPLAYEYDSTETMPVTPIPVPMDITNEKAEHRIVMDGATPVVLEALQAGDRVLGYMGLSDSNRVWTDDELSLIHSVGEQIALALDNARLFEDSQRSERQQLLISQILQSASNPELSSDHILPEIATILGRSLDFAVIIGTLPASSFPYAHSYALVDAEGKTLPFIQTDIFLDEERCDYYRNLMIPTTATLESFVTSIMMKDTNTSQDEVLNFLNEYDVEHALYIPMISGEQGKRFIGLMKPRSNPPIDQYTKELAIDLAYQIAVVMDNLDLSEETQQRSEELRLLYQNSLELSELLDPNDVLQAIAKLGMGLMDADASHQWVFLPEIEEIELMFDNGGGMGNRIGTRISIGKGLVGKAIEEQKTLVVDDYHTWEYQINGLIPPEFHAMLAMPLIGRYQPLGVLVCLSRQVAAFGSREISLAELFSAQAVAALENAQLNQDAQRRAEEFSSLYNAGIELITIMEVDGLLNRAAEWSYRVLSANHGIIYLLEPGSGEYIRGENANDPLYLIESTFDKETRDILTELIFNRMDSLLIHDVRTHDSLKTSALAQHGMLSLIGVPLQVGEDVIGIMCVSSIETHHFRDRDLDLLEFLATQVSSALQNSLQFDQTERALAVVGRQARYQSNVSQAVAILTEHGTESIQEVLHLLADAAEVPLALYYDAEQEGNRTYWRINSHWLSSELSKAYIHDLLLQQLNVNDMPEWAEMLTERVSFAAHLEDLPVELHKLLERFGSMMILTVQGEMEYPGFIALLRDSDVLWENQDVVTLQTTAAALSNTMARERLFNQVQQTLNETEALYLGGAALSESNTYQSILNVLLNHTILGKDSADVTLQLFNSMWSESHIPEYAEVVAYWSEEERIHTRDRFYVNDFPSSVEIIRKGAPTYIEDIVKDPRLDRRARAMFNKALGAQSVILVPLVVGGQRVGYLHATYPERQSFSSQDRRQLASLSQQAAIAVVNIQQLRATEARVRREQLIRQISSRIQEAPDVEGVLQSTIRELGRAFSTSRNKIQFQMPKRDAADMTGNTGE
jgi:GAF domain-containing protein/HAMP domain-containing protein